MLGISQSWSDRLSRAGLTGVVGPMAAAIEPARIAAMGYGRESYKSMRASAWRRDLAGTNSDCRIWPGHVLHRNSAARRRLNS